MDWGQNQFYYILGTLLRKLMSLGRHKSEKDMSLSHFKDFFFLSFFLPVLKKKKVFFFIPSLKGRNIKCLV